MLKDWELRCLGFDHRTGERVRIGVTKISIHVALAAPKPVVCPQFDRALIHHLKSGVLKMNEVEIEASFKKFLIMKRFFGHHP